MQHTPSQHQPSSAPRPPARRAYVGVYTYTSPEGKTIPGRIRWEDGNEWQVDRLLDTRPAHATKAGGFGMRYLVRIGQHERALFQLEDGRWFVEVVDEIKQHTENE